MMGKERIEKGLEGLQRLNSNSQPYKRFNVSNFLHEFNFRQDSQPKFLCPRMLNVVGRTQGCPNV
jgi:hypothetical protein